MFNVRIDTSDLEAKLGNISGPAFARAVADAVADEAVLPELAKYPAPSGKAQPFKSSKQRRFFFAALRRGQISVPYRRTGRLGSSFKKQPFSGGTDVVSTLGYADLVVGEKQGGYFKGTWPNVKQVAAKIEGDTAELIGAAEVIKQLQKAGLT